MTGNSKHAQTADGWIHGSTAGYERVYQGNLISGTAGKDGHRVLHYAIAYPAIQKKRYLVVNFHGMVTRPRYQPPVYGRFTSSAILGAIVMFVSDPILNIHPDSRIGWFLQAEPMADKLLQVIYDLATENRLEAVVWNGWSAGGYAAIRYAWRTHAEIPTMAFAYAPQNNPENFSWWGNYYSSLPDSAKSDPYCKLTGSNSSRTSPPRLLSSLLADGGDRGKHFAISIRANNGDAAHIVHHLGPIVKSAAGAENLDWAILRNGLGHGEESNYVFWEEFGDAVGRWTSGGYSPCVAHSTRLR